MKCENCIHYSVCEFKRSIDDTLCGHYKDKSLFVELPCKVGDTVYRIWSVGKHGKSIAEFVVTNVAQIMENIWVIRYQKQAKSLYSTPTRYQCNLTDIGKTVFLTIEDAEAKLKELGV